ncbi:P-loop containing nucleoside triphosphate hydrolase protein [Scleroderma citrinum]
MSLNIILFGETGVGKSSVINLIAGRPIADVSPDVEGCTMKSKEYRFDVEPMRVNIWDTVGLEEPEMGINGYIPAIEKAYTLIQRLREAGGVDLLLFCIRGNRVTMTTQSNYRLFYEVLCGQKVPIALVITHLEREADMEEWWIRNKKSIEKYGIKCAAHACVTGLPDNRGPNGKYEQSQRAMYNLLRQHNGSGRYTMPEGDWLARLIKGLKLFTGDKGGIPKGKKLENALIKRCGLDPAAALRVMEAMKQSEHSTPVQSVAAFD